MIHDNVKQIMAKTFGVKESEITEDCSIDTIETWDSLTHLRLIVAIEQAFDIHIEETDFMQMRSYLRIVNLLKKKGVL